MELSNYPCHPRNYRRGRTAPISFLVIHYVGALGGAKANALHYHNNKPGISAHYFVGHASEGAAVYASVPEGDTAQHCGRTDGKYRHTVCRNANSIGIELCCHKDRAGQWYFDPETLDRAVELARMLMDKYHIDTDHVVRHFDVTGKICPAPFVNDPAAWEQFKQRLEENSLTSNVSMLIREAVARELSERDKAEQEVSPWAKAAWEKATKAGIFDGTRPGGVLTREQLAVVLDRVLGRETEMK